MSIIDTIKLDQLNARKARLTPTATLLTTLIGEAEMIGKNDGNRAPTDDEVIKVVKKFIKNNEITIEAIKNSQPVWEQAVQSYQNDNSILEQYLPAAVSHAMLAETIADTLAAMENPSIKDIGKVMAELKRKLGTTFDGAQASKLIRQMLAD